MTTKKQQTPSEKSSSPSFQSAPDEGGIERLVLVHLQGLAEDTGRYADKDEIVAYIQSLQSRLKQAEAEAKRLGFILESVNLAIASSCDSLGIEHPKDIHPADIIDKYIVRSVEGTHREIESLKAERDSYRGDAERMMYTLRNYQSKNFEGSGVWAEECLSSLSSQYHSTK